MQVLPCHFPAISKKNHLDFKPVTSEAVVIQTKKHLLLNARSAAKKFSVNAPPFSQKSRYRGSIITDDYFYPSTIS
jgi:hypothetical protein